MANTHKNSYRQKYLHPATSNKHQINATINWKLCSDAISQKILWSRWKMARTSQISNCGTNKLLGDHCLGGPREH